MKTIDIGKSGLNASTLGIGCMRISELSVKETEELIDTALGLGMKHTTITTHSSETKNLFILFFLLLLFYLLFVISNPVSGFYHCLPMTSSKIYCCMKS